MRNREIDIIKALGIVCVVLGHSGFKGTGYIYLFHMAIFFIASGYCYNRKYVSSIEGLKEYFWKKIKGLYIPYVVFNGIFLITYNFLVKCNIYTDNLSFSNPVEQKAWWQIVNGLIALVHFDAAATQQLCGAAWFVIVLFYIVIGFVLLDYLLHKLNNSWLRQIILALSAIFSLIIGWNLHLHNIFLNGYLSPVFTCYFLYVLGMYLKSVYIYVKPIFDKLWYIIIGVGGIFFKIAYNYGNISLNINSYPNMLFLIVCSVTGWYWLYSIAYAIGKSVYLSKICCYIGKRTIWILFLHFISFKIVTAIQLLIYEEPMYLLASFPIYIGENGWWVFYTVVGVVIPLVCEKLFLWLKEKMLQFFIILQ